MTDSIKNSAPLAPASTAPVDGVATKARNASGTETGGKLVKKGNAAAGGATGSTGNRSAKKATGGAAYGITAKIPAYKSPEAGPTQGNGRLFQAAVNRTAPNFRDGINSQS
jgi:hypothetical protein